jgi:hypothetical protein
MGITDRFKEEAQKRVVKKTAKSALKKVVSEDRADDWVESVFNEDGSQKKGDGDEESDSDSNSIQISGDDTKNQNDSKTDEIKDKKDDVLSSVEERLDKMAEDIENEDDSGPVSSLDDMEEEIEKKRQKVDELEDTEEE